MDGYYGALQGLHKRETAERYGEEQVRIWRRSFDVQPPALNPDDLRNPALQEAYRGIEKEQLPLTESLKDTIARTVPYFEKNIRPEMEKRKRILIAAHGNSLRALVMYLERLTEEEIMKINLPTGVPLVYEFADDFSVVQKSYLGDPDVINQKMQKVANQGKNPFDRQYRKIRSNQRYINY